MFPMISGLIVLCIHLVSSCSLITLILFSVLLGDYYHYQFVLYCQVCHYRKFFCKNSSVRVSVVQHCASTDKNDESWYIIKQRIIMFQRSLAVAFVSQTVIHLKFWCKWIREPVQLAHVHWGCKLTDIAALAIVHWHLYMATLWFWR